MNINNIKRLSIEISNALENSEFEIKDKEFEEFVIAYMTNLNIICQRVLEQPKINDTIDLLAFIARLLVRLDQQLIKESEVTKMKNADKFGEIIDRIENIRCALDIPIPSDLHVKQMKFELSKLYDDLKNIYIEEENNNPWEE